MYKVAILLAAYNGTKWIEEQISSIHNQRGLLVTIYVSVDSSDDKTEHLVDQLCEKFSNIIALPYGHRFGGAAKNFYRLIEEVDFSDYDYISLADQDDIWHEDKLERAVATLNSGYDFYSSNVNAFWPSGKKILINKAQKQVEYDYFFEAAGPGCTYVIKYDAAVNLKSFVLNKDNLVSTITLHDWFIYSFARKNNFRWFIDSIPSMEYRQHGNNQVGANVTLLSALKRVKLIKNKWYRDEVYKIFDIVDGKETEFMRKVARGGYASNIFIMKNITKVRRRCRDRCLLFVVCLLNLF